MIQRSSLNKLAPGDLVLLHDPADRPRRLANNEWFAGFHWAIWRKLCDPDHYFTVVDWGGCYDPGPHTTTHDISPKFTVVSTDQTICNALLMAAIHLDDGARWHALVDRKFPQEIIDARSF